MSSSILTSLEDLEARLDAALADDPAGLPGAVLAEAVERQVVIRNKLAALDARLAAAFDASKEYLVNGARSSAAWMVTAGRERKCVADRRVRLGKALRGMPVVWAAFARGEINVDHVDELVAVRAGSEQVFADSERRLVDIARTKRFRVFRDELEYWKAIVDPQGADDEAERELADEHLHASASFQGQVRLDGWLEGRTDVRFPDERVCRLDDGTIIAPSTALSLGLAGHLRGLILDPDGVPLHFGQERRGFTGDLRTAMQLTHAYCGHGPGCDVPSWRCQIDHIEPFTDGGPTAPENGDPKCGPHNRWKERLDAEIRRRKRWRREHLDARGDPEVDADPSAEREEPDAGERAA